MSQQQTSSASLNAISSPVLADGASPCALQACPTLSAAGPDHHHASRLASQETNSDSLTSDTSRLPSCASSRSAALQSSLASRLRQQLENTGSMIYSLSWKQKATPAGRQYCQRQASVPRTKEIDFSLVPWATPHTSASTGAGTSGRAGGMNIQTMAALASWSTPTTRDHKDGSECLNVPINSLLGRQVWLTAWNSPAASDGNGGKRPHPETSMTGRHPSGRKVNMGLASQTHIGFIKTQPIRITASGQMLTGSDAAMESSGQLNPAHSRWLMGFPPEWDDCAVMAMPSFRRSRQSS